MPLYMVEHPIAGTRRVFAESEDNVRDIFPGATSVRLFLGAECRAAIKRADAILQEAGLPTYTELRSLLDEGEAALRGAARRLAGGVPALDEAERLR